MEKGMISGNAPKSKLWAVGNFGLARYAFQTACAWILGRYLPRFLLWFVIMRDGITFSDGYDCFD